MNVLWLASWYPNRTNPSTGDFIERQAIAVAPYLSNLFVVAVFKDESLPPGKIEVVRSVHGNLRTYIAYYGRGTLGKLFEPIRSTHFYLQLQKKMFQEIKEQFGLPRLVHVHVAMKAGWFALALKKKYALDYLVTEHWTGYSPDAVPTLKDMGYGYVRLTKKVLNHASRLIPVSQNLAHLIAGYGIRTPYTVIPNVVDTSLFRFEPTEPRPFRFVHFSYLNRQKNPEGIIDACALLHGKGLQFECVLTGAEAPGLEKRISALGLSGHVIVRPEIPIQQVASAMREAHALVLFSRFENLPCVVLEALCSGLPVVSSDVGGISEVVNASNGILVPEGDLAALAAAMEQMMMEYKRYDRKAVAEKAAAQFNNSTIGRMHLEVYQKQVAASSG